MANQPQFDVFLAHNSQDKPQVRAIATKLKERGLKYWIDEEQIPPGRWFQDVIQQAIPKVKSAAICIGTGGLGKWQAAELRSFSSQCVNSDIPVIPVLLPGVKEIPEHLSFLKELNWVNFANGIEDIKALDNLEWGITGERRNSPGSMGLGSHVPLSQDQPKPDEKRKKSLLVTGGGIVTTLAVVGSGMIYLNWNSQSKVPQCLTDESCLFKIFRHASNAKENLWSFPVDTPENDPRREYVLNSDRECGGSSSSPVLKLQYEFHKESGLSNGWGIQWAKGFDLSKFSHLDFKIKSASGSGKIRVGLKDINEKQSSQDYSANAPRDWRKISIPLSQIENNVEKSKIWAIYIAFLSQDGPGTICIDNIQLH